MRKETLLAICCLACTFPALSQYNKQADFLKANSVWAFGAFAGLDFNSGSAVPIETPNMAYEGTASVADSLGNLLFHLGGWLIFRGNGQIMPNSNGIMPSNQTSNSAQGALIVPFIDTPWKYYVFKNMENSSYNNGSPPPYLSYSVVDMQLDNGLGDVELGQRNTPMEITHPLTEGMIAIPGDNCDVWVLTHTNSYPNHPTRDSQTSFKAWQITDQGVNPTPVISLDSQAKKATATLQAFGIGCLSVSPDRKIIAMASVAGTNPGVRIFDFDPATGLVSGGITITSRASYGVCFSPDNTKLYVTSSNNHIYQYQIASRDSAQIASTEYIVYRSARYTGLKLYRDTIYVAPALEQINSGQLSHPYTLGAVYIDRIANPRGIGSSCNFQFNAIRLLPGTGNIAGGLPSEVVFPFIHPIQSSVRHDTLCHTISSGYTTKILEAPSGFTFYEWDNGNNESSRQIAEPGTYWVKYYNNRCTYHIDSFIVASQDLSFSLGEDQTVAFCNHPLSYYELRVNLPSNVQYKWHDGSTDNRFVATRAGTYWVEASASGCSASDTVVLNNFQMDAGSDIRVCAEDSLFDITLSLPPMPAGAIIKWENGPTGGSLHVSDTGTYRVQVILPPCVFYDSIRVIPVKCDTLPKDTIIEDCIISLPNAFTPNGDGKNDIFLPIIEPSCLTQSFLIQIYNRYGERVFHSNDPKKGWDGNYNGHPSPVGTYFYNLYIGGDLWKSRSYRKGDVLLIR